MPTCRTGLLTHSSFAGGSDQQAPSRFTVQPPL